MCVTGGVDCRIGRPGTFNGSDGPHPVGHCGAEHPSCSGCRVAVSPLILANTLSSEFLLCDNFTMGVPQGPRLPPTEPSTSGNLHLICGDGDTPADLGSLVSAADLQAALDRIKIRSDELKEQVYLTLTKHHKDLLQLASTAERTSDDVDDIGREVAAASAVLGNEENEDGETCVKLPGQLDSLACISTIELMIALFLGQLNWKGKLL